MQCSQRPEEFIGTSGTGVTDGCEPPSRFWESKKPGSSAIAAVLLTFAQSSSLSTSSLILLILSFPLHHFNTLATSLSVLLIVLKEPIHFLKWFYLAVNFPHFHSFLPFPPLPSPVTKCSQFPQEILSFSPSYVDPCMSLLRVLFVV